MGSVQQPQRSFDCRATSYLPPSFTQFLQNPLRSTPPVESTTARRPSKRKRTSTPVPAPSSNNQLKPLQYVVLRWTTINIKFPILATDKEPNYHCQSTMPVRILLSRKDPRTFSLDIELEDKNGSPDVTKILETELLAAELPLEDVKLAMLEDIQRYRRGVQGRLWSETTLTLHKRDDAYHLAIAICLKWETTETLMHIGPWEPRENLERCLNKYLPGLNDDEDGLDLGTPHAFYSCAHMPEKDDPIASSLQIPDVRAELYPFQKRTVVWLLRREGMQWSPSGLTALNEENGAPDDEDLPHSFFKVYDDEGTPFFFSDEMKIATTDIAPFKVSKPKLRGGILAEEMGLGKTVEIISLITLNQFPSTGVPIDINLPNDALPIRATLLVVPTPLALQWISEIKRHSPSLSVYQYEGFNSRSWKKTDKSPSEEALAAFATHDIVVTTYSVISSELLFTSPAPKRNLRTAPKYERPISPLVKALWWRVCLDEAQMVGSGVSGAAVVAEMIPRVNAWGISGTPAKRGVSDLHGLLIFLKYEPYAFNKTLWSHLLHSPRNFARCFNEIALRHTKRSVRDELELPPQKRFVITMRFTPIEEQHYQSVFKLMAAQCGMDLNGRPLTDYWVPNYEAMQKWLIRLRQTALHPEIGEHNRRELAIANAPLRTQDELIVAMLQRLDANIRLDERQVLRSEVKRGQILLKSSRVQEALELWGSVLGKATNISKEIRGLIELEKQPSRGTLQNQKEPTDGAEEEKLGTGVLKIRLRHTLEIEHMSVFFQANGNYQLKSQANPRSPEYKLLGDKEEQAYAEAKTLRREILQEATRKVTDLMSKISAKVHSDTLMNIPEISSQTLESSSNTAQALSKLGKFLDVQANQLHQWRDLAVKLLTQPLVDDDDNKDETTGDEYEESTKIQEEVVVLISVLRALISDRRCLLLGQQNMLTETDVKNALVQAKQGMGPYPEKMIELLEIRQNLKANPDVSSFRGIISEARHLVSELRQAMRNGSNRHQAELLTAEAEFDKAQSLLTAQTKTTESLGPDLELFTSTMNARVEYYRQLQQVSDMVRDLPEEDGHGNRIDYNLEYDRMLVDEEDSRHSIAASKTTKRYFEHLRNQAASDEEQICVICQEPFEEGYFTTCGHYYCRLDFKQWWAKHRTCPTCKRYLTSADFQDMVCRPQALSGQADSNAHAENEHGVNITKKSPLYSEISAETLKEIKNIQLLGGSQGTFTSKVDTLAKHIIWLREKDPGAKSIVFCQYKDFLSILSQAFTRYGIGYDSIEKSRGVERFRNDPGVEVFLLHARAHSAGLNLVNANHVFLCEPLLQTALELQAIARVDRIGQLQATTVWLYLIEGTVEQSIYDISVERRLEHLGKSRKGKSREGSFDPDMERSIEQANSLELQGTNLSTSLVAQKNGGEAVANQDVWKCLFGSRQKAQAQQDGEAEAEDL